MLVTLSHFVAWGTVLKKTISIRWRVLIYILAFVAAVLFLLVLFQTVFLERFYEMVRTQQVQDVSDTIVMHIDDKEDIESVMASVSLSNDTCVRVIYGYSGEQYQSELQQGCAISNFTEQSATTLIAQTYANGGEFTTKVNETVTYNTILGRFTQESEESFDIIHSRLVSTADNENVLVLVSARLSPLSPTISTIRIQLYYIAAILIVLAIILTLVITSKIVKPLEKMSENALLLATGDYNVEFKSTQYKEVQELAQSLNYASKQLSESEQHRRDLIANVSHDLRTPLTMISGYGELMRDLPQENNAENAQVIIDEANRLTLLVNDLLELSKFQAHRLELNVATFDIQQLVKRAKSIYAPKMKELDVDFIVDNKKRHFVVGDERRIEQVLYNFINNAIHYGSSGKKVIVRVIEKEESVRVEVQDFGVGIAEDQLGYIWDRYYKVDKEHVRNTVGSGLGLAIVKEILDQHEVEFGVDSKVNEGTLFYFELNKK